MPKIYIALPKPLPNFEQGTPQWTFATKDRAEKYKASMKTNNNVEIQIIEVDVE